MNTEKLVAVAICFLLLSVLLGAALALIAYGFTESTSTAMGWFGVGILSGTLSVVELIVRIGEKK